MKTSRIKIFYHVAYTTQNSVNMLLAQHRTIIRSSYESGPKRVQIVEPTVHGYTQSGIYTRPIHANNYLDMFGSNPMYVFNVINNCWRALSTHKVNSIKQ